MPNRRAAAGALLFAVAFSGCGQPPAASEAPGQHPPPPEQVPDGPRETSSRIAEELLEIDPAVAEAGDTVELRFAERTGRGRAYALERHTGDSWQWLFSLTSDAHSFTWWYAGAEVPVPADVHYDTSVTVPLPDAAEPGSYRICTSDGDCAELTIE